MTRWYASGPCRTVRRHGVLAAVVASVLAASQPAVACSCMPLTRPQAAERAAVVFTGIARSVSRPLRSPFTCTRSSMDPVFVRFAVETVYKGDVRSDTVVRTVEGGASCGYTFDVGERYTVFAVTGDGGLDTNLCSGNAPGVIAPDAYGLPAGRAP